MEKMIEEEIRDDMEIYVFGNWVEISFVFKTENRRVGLELKMHYF